MEVAQIARSIARYLNLNEDLAETLSLAHDLRSYAFWSCWRRVFK